MGKRWDWKLQDVLRQVLTVSTWSIGRERCHWSSSKPPTIGRVPGGEGENRGGRGRSKKGGKLMLRIGKKHQEAFVIVIPEGEGWVGWVLSFLPFSWVELSWVLFEEKFNDGQDVIWGVSQLLQDPRSSSWPHQLPLSVHSHFICCCCWWGGGGLAQSASSICFVFKEGRIDPKFCLQAWQVSGVKWS